jgi:hypothetical protein
MPYYLNSMFRRSLVLISLHQYEVLLTVCQGQFYLHAVVVGVSEDAVLRDVFYRKPLLLRCLFWINLAAPQQIERVRLHSTCTSFPFIVSIIKMAVDLPQR